MEKTAGARGQRFCTGTVLILSGILLGLLAAAYLMKLNAAIALIALFICAALDAVKKKKVQPVLYALLSVVLSVSLASAVIWQYEVRSGVSLRGNISTLARLTMGLRLTVWSPLPSWHLKHTWWYDMLYNHPTDLTPQREEDISKAAWVAKSSLPPFLTHTYPSIVEVFRNSH